MAASSRNYISQNPIWFAAAQWGIKKKYWKQLGGSTFKAEGVFFHFPIGGDAGVMVWFCPALWWRSHILKMAAEAWMPAIMAGATGVPCGDLDFLMRENYTELCLDLNYTYLRFMSCLLSQFWTESELISLKTELKNCLMTMTVKPTSFYDFYNIPDWIFSIIIKL